MPVHKSNQVAEAKFGRLSESNMLSKLTFTCNEFYIQY